MKLSKLGLALSMSVLGATAVAAPNVANTTQQGSALIFPRIDVSKGMTTIVRMANNFKYPVKVKCYYMDWNKDRTDFQFDLTPFNPIWFDAKTGAGTKQVQPFQNLSSPYGELKCWAVNRDADEQISHNYLSGTATILNYDDGSAAEYSAWSFFAHAKRNVEMGTGGELTLAGVAGTYDYCPKFLVGHYTPYNEVLGDDLAQYGYTQLSVASCTEDLRQDWEWIVTKLNFEIWNEDETLFTGAWECSDSWHQVYLDSTAGHGFDGEHFDEYMDKAGANFDIPDDAGYYRVWGGASSQCDKQVPLGGGKFVKSQDVGLVGVQVTELSVGAHFNDATIATTLTSSGKMRGSIKWDRMLAPVPKK